MSSQKTGGTCDLTWHMKVWWVNISRLHTHAHPLTHKAKETAAWRYIDISSWTVNPPFAKTVLTFKRHNQDPSWCSFRDIIIQSHFCPFITEVRDPQRWSSACYTLTSDISQWPPLHHWGSCHLLVQSVRKCNGKNMCKFWTINEIYIRTDKLNMQLYRKNDWFGKPEFLKYF